MNQIKSLFPNDEIYPMLTGWAINIVIALLIYVIGKWLAVKISKMIRKMLTTQQMDDTLVNFLGNIVYAVLFTAVVLASLDTLGIPVTSLLAVVGAAGLAIGLALKDSLGNFASGVMLVMFRPFTKGDFVEVAGTSGKVNEVRIFSTILTTGDNKMVIIPNGLVAADTITNYTALEHRRVDLVFGVGYDDDLKLTRDVLTRICKEHPKVLDEPACNIFVLQLGASSVDFAVRPWTRTEDYWTVWGDIHEQAKVELEAAGLNIPYPQQDVHLHHSQPTEPAGD
jgi:small conductance mechanosensitive channel